MEALLVDTDTVIAKPSFSNVIPQDLKGPLIPGKGLPPDVSELVANEAGRWQLPWFCSYLT